jgi:fucose 4-O-acetylase-like acetyltransferase
LVKEAEMSASRDAGLARQRAVVPLAAPEAPGPRLAYADNLKVALVAGVVVAHVMLAWNGLTGAWVLSEMPVREPLLSVLLLASVVGVSFGMPLFFMVAGLFTPASLQRKGTRRFLLDRTVRLLVPSVAFTLLLTPPIEYVDSSNADFRGSFWEFIPHSWLPLPPPPGPTWFLGVLLLFSVAYAGWRRIRPLRGQPRGRLTGRALALTVVAVALASYVVRIWAPFGEERWHMAVAQAPSWVTGFVIGVLAAERGWFNRIDPTLLRRLRWSAWLAVVSLAVIVAVLVTAGGGEATFGGRGTWQSLVFAVLDATLMVTMSIWVLDVFRRRVTRQGPLARSLGRAAYAAFFVHQGVLIVLILGSRQLAWAPEVKFFGVAVVGVALSFALGDLLRRAPLMGRVL